MGWEGSRTDRAGASEQGSIKIFGSEGSSQVFISLREKDSFVV